MIKLKNITKIYNEGKDNELVALRDVSIHICKGELVAITGKSGSGKSTLLHIISMIDDYQSGEYFLNGICVNGKKESERTALRNEQLGIVMQDFALIEDMTASENVRIPLDFNANKVSDKRKKVNEALDIIHISDLATKKVCNLSGGQKQRTAIARAIVNEPQIILADEPTGALDQKTSREMMDIFCDLSSQGKTVVIITHDPYIAKRCERIIQLSDGQVIGDEINEKGRE